MEIKNVNGIAKQKGQDIAGSDRGSSRIVQAKKADLALGTVKDSSARSIIPVQLQTQLSAFSQKYALPFDLGNLSIDQVTPDKIKAMRKLVDMISANSKLLPELIKQSKKLMKADISVATANAELAKAQLKHQEKLDSIVADLFISCAKHAAKSNLLASKTAKRVALIEQKNALQTAYHEQTVFGCESNLLEVQYSLMVDNAKLKNESKEARLEMRQKERDSLLAYIDSAYM